jgi:hypothetical protein
VLVRGTEPKRIDAGATEIVAAPFEEEFPGALAIPLQPEMERIAIARRTRTATEIYFLLIESECAAAAYFSAPACPPFIRRVSITRHCESPNLKELLSHWADLVQGVDLHRGGEGRVKRRAALRFRCAARRMVLIQIQRSLWHGGENFRRIDALHVAGIDGRNYIVISQSGSHGRIRVCGG